MTPSKKRLLYVISNKGQCFGYTEKGCNCLTCTLTKGIQLLTGESFYEKKYENALNIFLKQYGKDELFEELL